MKTILILVGLLAVSAAEQVSLDDGTIAELRGMPRGAIEIAIQELLNCLRIVMQQGGYFTGGMVLDPLKVDYYNYSLEMPPALNADGVLEKVTVHGLSDFTLNKAKVSILGMKMDYDLTLHNLKASGLYSMVGKLFNAISIDGQGPAGVKLDEINVSGYIKLRLKKLKYVQISEMKLVLKLAELEVKLDNLTGPDYGELFNALLNDTLRQVLQTHQNTISKLAELLVKKKLNPLLENMTLQNLLDLILSKGASNRGLLC